MKDNPFADPPSATPAAAEPAPAVPAAPAPVDDLRQHLTQLTQTVGSLAQNQERLTRSLSAAVEAPPMEPAPGPQPTTEELLNRFAQDPTSVIDERARRAANEATAGLQPTVLQFLDAANSYILDTHARRIDEQFGAGTFDEFYAPVLKDNVAQLQKVNPKALADRNAMQALVDRITGQQFQKLLDRQSQTAKAREESKMKGIQEIVAQIPGGGAPRLTRKDGGPGSMPEDFDTFSREIEAATGERVDRDLFTKLHHAGNTIEDYLAVVAPGKRDS